MTNIILSNWCFDDSFHLTQQLEGWYVCATCVFNLFSKYIVDSYIWYMSRVIDTPVTVNCPERWKLLRCRFASSSLGLWTKDVHELRNGGMSTRLDRTAVDRQLFRVSFLLSCLCNEQCKCYGFVPAKLSSRTTILKHFRNGISVCTQ